MGVMLLNLTMHQGGKVGEQDQKRGTRQTDIAGTYERCLRCPAEDCEVQI